jgi:hypothetical protein
MGSGVATPREDDWIPYRKRYRNARREIARLLSELEHPGPLQSVQLGLNDFQKRQAWEAELKAARQSMAAAASSVGPRRRA